MATIIPQPDIEDLDYCGKLTASEINGEATYMQAVIDSYETAYNIQIQRVVANAVDLVYVVDEDMSYLRINTVSATIPDYISIYQHATKDNTVRIYEYIGETTLDVVGGTYTCYRTGGNFLDEVMAGGAYYMVCPTTETEATEPGPAEPTGDGYLDYPGLDYYTRRIKEELAEKLEAYKKRADLGKVFVYKGSVDNYEDLPTEGLEIGHVYNVVNAYPDKKIKAGDNVCWNGEDWDDLAGSVDTSELLSLADAAGMKEEVQAAIDAIKDKLGNYILKNAADEVIGEYLTWEELLTSFEVVTDDEVYALFENGGEPLEPTNGTLDIEGDFELGEDFRVNGNVVVTGDITGSGTLYATGTITCNGTISATVKEGASLSECDISVDDGTTTFTASAVLADGFLSTTKRITNEAICVINCNVTGAITSSYGIQNYNSLTLNGNVDFSITGTIYWIANYSNATCIIAGELTLYSSSYTARDIHNEGDLIFAAGAKVSSLTGGRSIYNHGGTITISEGAYLELVGVRYGIYNYAGVITVREEVYMRAGGDSLSTGIALSNAGTFIVESPITIENSATSYSSIYGNGCYNSGELIANAKIIINHLHKYGYSFSNAGNVSLNDDIIITDAGSSNPVRNTGTITGNGSIILNDEPYDF